MDARQRRETGKRIRLLRDDLGWTQGDLAQRLGVGVSTISGFERGASGIARVAGELAQALGTTTDYLYGLSDNPLPSEEGITPPDPLRDVILSEFDQLDEAERRALIEIAVTLRLMHQRRGSRVIE